MNHNYIQFLYFMCFIKTGKQLFDSLNRPLELSKTDESLWSDKCVYIEPTKCKDLNPENYNFVVMQLNIRNILAHQCELRLHDISNKNLRVDTLLLCETFLASKTEKLVNIPCYNLVTNSRKNHKGEGVAVLIRH